LWHEQRCTNRQATWLSLWYESCWRRIELIRKSYLQERKMKKRKPPVLLLSILLVLVGVAVVYGISQGSNAPVAPDPGSTLSDTKNDAPSAVALGNNTMKAAEGAKGKGPQPPTQQADQGPSIAVHQEAPHFTKPKPSDQGAVTSLRGQ
jgi:hypothetical protein